jgi:hypothetical protein
MNKHITTAALALAIALTLTSCEEKKSTPAAAENRGEAANTLKLAHTVTFKNKEIPITIYYSKIDYSEWGETDIWNRLDFEYDGVKHSIIPADTIPLTYPILITVDDYNFDGYMDIGIVSWQGIANIGYKVFIYNPKKKDYDYNAELSELSSLMADAKTQTVTSSNRGGHAGMIYSFSQYKWEKGKLALIVERKQDYDDGLDKYIRITKTLQKDKLLQKTDTVSGEEAEPEIPTQETALP